MSRAGAWALAAAFALAAAPAAAERAALGALTGSWQLELRCKGASAGQPEKQTLSYFLPIVHDDATGLLEAGAGDTGALQGLVVLDAAKPSRFWLSVASCDLGSPIRSLSVHARGKLDGDAGKGKGTAVLFDALSGSAASCKAKLERTDANPPPVVTCP